MGMRARGLSNSLLYNYQYDQLNRLVAMDAWNRTGAAWSAITKVPDFKENISYDPNGNILGYKRNGNNSFAGKPLDMDSLGYKYIPGTNRLDHITDNVSASNYPSDIDGQAAGNYKYDSIGQLVSDDASGITNISWTVYGKIATIAKSGDTLLAYTYDAGGNRVSKSVIHGTDTTTTWYVRDAQGNVLSVYTYGDPAVQGKDLTQTEAHIYGSSRLGILKLDRNVERTVPATTSNLRLLGVADSVKFMRGNKLFELTNHLGNVLVTISDKRYGVRTVDDTTAGYFIPDVVSANDYYPFGSLQPGRSYAQSGDGYRYGFNGQERSDEIKGDGNSYTAEFWEYDPRIGRRWNIDPKPSALMSPYATLGNSPILFSDPKGDTTVTGAGGTQSIDIDEKKNSLQFYTSSHYNVAGSKTPVPVQNGQLRSFTNELGTFTATWSTSANGDPTFSGYKNDRNQTLEESVTELRELQSSFVYKLNSIGEYLAKENYKDPVGFNLKITSTMLTMSAMSAVEPTMLPETGYNPTLTLSEKSETELVGNFAYRALTRANALSLSEGDGIFAKAPSGSWSLEEHLMYGSSARSAQNDPWISITSNYKIAKKFSGGNGIIQIDLSQLPVKSMQQGWMTLPRNSPAYHFSIWQQETSVYKYIPKSAIKILE